MEPAARTLLLALDGVPLRVATRARSTGFGGWPLPTALVAPFPSVTHVSFASLFQPFGVAPTRRYELRHFDAETNEMVNFGPLAYGRDAPPWSGYIDAPHRTLVTEISNYASPRLAARFELDRIEREVLVAPGEVVVAYVGATDGLMHLHGDDSTVEFMAELDEWISQLTHRHLVERHRPLRVVLFSDHGCGSGKVRYASGFEQLLRDAGLRVVERLERSGDVVAPRSGMVNYGALFLFDDADADRAARAVAAHDAVELAAWASQPDSVDVVARSSHGRVTWRGDAGRQKFRYEAIEGDVLRLTEVVARLEADEQFDDAGFAEDDTWLLATSLAYYPDPLHRLAQALTGDRVASRATVLFSLSPDCSWGMYSAVAGAWARGGRLDGTHGGLDRESSLGFFMASHEELASTRAQRSDAALAPFAEAVAASRSQLASGRDAT